MLVDLPAVLIMLIILNLLDVKDGNYSGVPASVNERPLYHQLHNLVIYGLDTKSKMVRNLNLLSTYTRSMKGSHNSTCGSLLARTIYYGINMAVS